MYHEGHYMLRNRAFFKKLTSGRWAQAFWILLSVVLMFAGPSYMIIVLRHFIKFPYLQLTSVILFIIGLYLFLNVYEEK